MLLGQVDGKPFFRVKMMGQVDGKPFFKACFARSGGNASGIHYGTHLKFRDVEIKLRSKFDFLFSLLLLSVFAGILTLFVMLL